MSHDAFTSSNDALNSAARPATLLIERNEVEVDSSVGDAASSMAPEGAQGRSGVVKKAGVGGEEEAEGEMVMGKGREAVEEEDEERDATPRASLENSSRSSEATEGGPIWQTLEDEKASSSPTSTTPVQWTFVPSPSSPLSFFPLTSPSLSTSRPSTTHPRMTEPPTPLAVPGGWSSSRWTDAPLRWRVLARGKGRSTDEDDQGEDEEEDEDEGLILPPPFLADDSPKESFDGTSRCSRPLSSLIDETRAQASSAPALLAASPASHATTPASTPKAVLRRLRSRTMSSRRRGRSLGCLDRRGDTRRAGWG